MTIRKHLRLLCLVSALASPAALAAPAYQLTFLPDGFVGYEMNNAGQIVGRTREAQALIWSDSGIVNLSRLAPGIEAYAINNRGEVAGNFGAFDANAFIYADGQIRDIGRVAGLNYIIPHAINDKGQVAGTAGNYAGETSRGFFYDGNTMNAIGTFGGDASDAYGLNNKGTVVGTAEFPPPPDEPSGEERAFVYRDGSLRQLRTPEAVAYTANDINDAGAIVGNAALLDSGEGGFFVHAGGAITILGDGDARGINNLGAIVGNLSYFEDFQTHAFLYDGGVQADLNSLVAETSGWTLTRAEDINDAGQILGTACLGSTSNCRTVRLDLVPAVPEPASLAMLAGGLLTLSALRRKRKPTIGPGQA